MPVTAQRIIQRSPPKPELNMDQQVNPSQWLNFSLPPRQRNVPGSAVSGYPRRSRRGGGVSRERFVHANFRFILKPTETLSYGAHFADPDISLHWPHILQVLVPTFSAYSIAQGYVSDQDVDLEASSMDEGDLESAGDGEGAERRRRMEEERRGRMCPICLGKPVAGRMTICGHIFCFPCILHYIQLSDMPKSAKCPICGDTVHEGMLKSVRYLDPSAFRQEPEDHVHHHVSEHEHDHEPMVGEMDGFETHSQRIHMRLIQRPQMTTMALPVAPAWPSEAIPPHTAPFYFLPNVLAYSRYMLATPDYMLDELQRELDELKQEWELLRGDSLGRDFVRAAREKVERQVGKVRAELMTPMVRKAEEDSRDALDDIKGGAQERARQRERRDRPAPSPLTDVPKEFLAIQDIPPNRPVEPNPMPPTTTSRRGRRRPATAQNLTPATPSYYFYQSSVGANVFLHPLDIRILLAHFKSYSLFPARISFSSSGFDPGSINDELRKRCKYLSHLPAGTEVVFVEAELEEIVGKEGLAAFEQPLKARRAKRRERVKKEDRAKSRWEKAEREKMPIVEDREFALALERSTIDTSWAEQPALPVLSSSAGSSSGPSPSTSPSAPSLWVQPRTTFATALGSQATPSPLPARREDDPDLDAAWEAFEGMNVRESEKGGGADGGGRRKKTPKKTLVLGGGMGGRRL